MQQPRIVINHKEESPHFFLSNSFPQAITYNGLLFICNEGAFQASKAKKIAGKLPFRPLDGYAARDKGRKIHTSPSWYNKRLPIMRDLLELKFGIAFLMVKLKNTGRKELISSCGDLFWGMDELGRGANNLGILLMELRYNLSKK